MHTGRPSILSTGLVVLLLGATFLIHRQIQLDQHKLDERRPPGAVSAMVADPGRPVTIAWRLPPDLDLAAVTIRHAPDRFPETITAGAPIAELPPDTSHFVLDIQESALPTPVYLSIFTTDTEGLVSAPATLQLYCDLDGCITVPDLTGLLRITSPADAAALRSVVLRMLWEDGHLPGGLPAEVATLTDPRYPGAARIDTLQIELGFGLTSTAWYFSPPAPTGRLMVYHQGHDGPFHMAAPVIRRLLDEGFHVLALDMPLVGGNPSPGGGLDTHNDLARLPRAMRFFIEPVVVALNHALAESDFRQVSMLGISGGGWTTTVVAALDSRIGTAYAVAGGYPPYIRDQIPGNDGDFEQRNVDFWNRISYLEMFALAAEGDRYVQFFIYNDPCCSQNSYAFSYMESVTETAERLGGMFEILIDYDQTEHAVSAWMLDQILAREITR